jgi:hypothetical protein
MNKNPVLCLLGLILIFSGLASGESLIRVGIADRSAVQDVKSCFTDISRVEPFAVTGSATEEGIQSLRAKGYAVEVLVPDEQEAALKAVSQPPEPAIPGVFHSYPWMCALLDTIARQHPTLCRLDTIGTSFGGRRMLALRITSNPTSEQNKPEILWEGGIHGDEIMGPELCLNLINALTDSYALSSRIQRFVDTREIWVVPNVNPDGRVNMSRYNGNNVDINRNYGYNWDRLETGGGTGPFSEPETKAFRNLIWRNPVTIRVSYHGGTHFISYPWSYTLQGPRDSVALLWLSQRYYSFVPYEVGQGSRGMYDMHGSSKDFDYGCQGMHGWSIEVSMIKQPPQTAIDSCCAHNLPAMYDFIWRAKQGVEGVVTDATNSAPLQARVTVTQLGWPAYTDSLIGDYHRYLRPGTYSIAYSANGYNPQTVSNVVVPTDSSVVVNVALTRAPGVNYSAYKVPAVNIRDSLNRMNNTTITPSALGPSDGVWVALGKSGWINLDMGPVTRITNRTGNDFTVVAQTGDTSRYWVWIGNNEDGPWTRVNASRVAGTQSFDIQPTGLTSARYVRIVDDSIGSYNGPTDGFHLDAVEALPSSGVESQLPAGSLIADYDLGPALPNPSRGGMTFSYAVPREGPLAIKVYGLTGQVVRTLISGNIPPGNHRVSWDGRDDQGTRVPSGVYFYRLEADNFARTQKVVIAR